MIKINKTDILNEFYTLFPDVEKDARIFSVCADLTVLNNGFEYSKKPFYSLPLSIMTYITVKVTNDDIFKIRFSDNDTEYIASCEDLHFRNKNDEIKEIYNAIACCKQGISGARILFSYDSSSDAFKNNVSAVFLAFSILNSRNLPTIQSIPKKTADNSINLNLNCLIYGRKNCLISSDINEKIKYYPFDLKDKKLIFLSFDENILYVKDSLTKAINDCTLSKKDCLSEQIFSDTAKNYVFDEYKRTYSYITNSDDGYALLKPSSYELCNYLKPSHNIKKMLDASYSTSMSCFSFVSLRYSSLVCIVENENVDTFVNHFYPQSEKIIGKEPKIYIADSKNSGIELL